MIAAWLAQATVRGPAALVTACRSMSAMPMLLQSQGLPRRLGAGFMLAVSSEYLH